ncbi:ATP-binding protein [Methylobacterium nigriterrae]|uniref:ATP-binding protein n=1 Tax=Methylobacterium nigriterrae TaxID=3127512 RepID=UPI003013FD4C
MTDDGAGATTLRDDRTIDTALRSWAREPRLAALLSSPAGAYLILDGDGTRLVHASEAARGVARALAPAEGGALPAGLSEEIGRVGVPADAPRLARLSFDPRRIAPPSLCWLARGSLADGRPALLVALTQAPPRLRAMPGRQAAAPALPAAPAVASADPARSVEAADPEPVAVGERFVWRSDAADVITEVGGRPAALLAPRLAGRRFADLDAAGALAEAGPLLAALAARGTFRAIPVVVGPDDPAGALGIELSGAPLGRAGQPFLGYGGFGLVRSVTVPSATAALPEAAAPLTSSGMATLDPPPADDSDPSEPEGEDGPVRIATLAPAALTLAALSLAALVPAARFGRIWTAGGRSGPAAGRPWSTAAEPPGPPDESAAPAAEIENGRPAPDPALTVTEHAAFREIARALGARFAGDERPENPPDGEAGGRQSGGSVTPFPAARPAEPRPAGPDEAEALAILDALPAGLLLTRDDAVLYANRHLLDLAGFPDLAALAAAGVAGLFKGLPPQGREAPEAATGRLPDPVALATREGGSRQVELERLSLRWAGSPADGLLVRATRPDDPAGQLAAERVARSFREAHAAEARSALDALDDGIVTLDAAGRVVALNRAAAAIFDCTAREVVGVSFVALFEPESALGVRASLQATGIPAAREVAVRGRGGTLPLELKLAHPDAEGRRVAILRDLGPMKRLAAEVERARAAADAAGAWKSDFLAKVSHEIRTPMNGILGFADVMLKEQFGPVGNDRYRDYLRDIHESGEHVLGLVSDLVDLARIEAGRLDLAFGPVPLNDLVSGCVALLQPQAARDRIVVRTSFAADLTTLVADERSMRQAALNVIANAIKFTEPGGQVIVSTTVAERGEITLRVRDTGIGMTADEIEAALEPFRQVALAAPRKGGGSGLGLPLTKALVEANQGRFRITSRKDEGTLVEMLFPARLAKSA